MYVCVLQRLEKGVACPTNNSLSQYLEKEFCPALGAHLFCLDKLAGKPWQVCVCPACAGATGTCIAMPTDKEACYL